MRKIPVISSDEKLNQFIQQECALFGSDFVPEFYEDPNAVIESLKYELPEIKIMYFSDSKIDIPSLLQEVRADPWLHYGGLVAIHDNEDEQKLQEIMKDQNVVAVLKKREFLAGFSRLLKIVRQNKQILFQRGIQQHLIKNISGSFVIDNDPLDITTYSNLVTNYLYNANLINRDGKEKLHVALLELLVNAIEHGNCKIGFDEKTAWLEQNRDIMDLIRKKNEDTAIRARKVYFTYTIAPGSSKFTIRDEGEGFDWRSRLAAQPNEPGLHGMGMVMAKLYVQDLGYNEAGNEVCFEVEHQKNESNVIPGIFVASPELYLRGRAVYLLRGRGVGLPLLHRLGPALCLLQGKAGLGPDPGRHLPGRDVLPSLQPQVSDHRVQGKDRPYPDLEAGFREPHKGESPLRDLPGPAPGPAPGTVEPPDVPAQHGIPEAQGSRGDPDDLVFFLKLYFQHFSGLPDLPEQAF